MDFMMKGVIAKIICLLALTATAYGQPAWGAYPATNAVSDNSWVLMQDWALGTNTVRNMLRIAKNDFRTIIGAGSHTHLSEPEGGLLTSEAIPGELTVTTNINGDTLRLASEVGVNAEASLTIDRTSGVGFFEFLSSLTGYPVFMRLVGTNVNDQANPGGASMMLLNWTIQQSGGMGYQVLRLLATEESIGTGARYMISSGPATPTFIVDILGNVRASGNYISGVYTQGVTSNVLYVDKDQGSDAFGTRGRADKPWFTINAALSNIVSGDTLIIRPGLHTVNRSGIAQSGSYESWDNSNFILKSLTNVTVLGWGAVMNTFEVTPGEVLGNVWSIADCDNIRIEGLTFQGLGMNPVIADQICGDITLWGTNSNITIKDCTFIDYPNHGILISQDAKATGPLVTGCKFINGGTTNHTVLNVDGAGVAGVGQGSQIVNNYFENVVRGIELEGPDDVGLGQTIISGNMMTNVLNLGIMCLNTSADDALMTDTLISGNAIFMDKTLRAGVPAQHGIVVTGGRRYNISDNIVRGAYHYGILVTSSHWRINDALVQGNTVSDSGWNIGVIEGALQITNVTVANNMVLDPLGTNIVVDGKYTKVMGNTVKGANGPGIQVQEAAGAAVTLWPYISGNWIFGHEPAIQIDSGVLDATVFGNSAIGAVTPLSDSGTSTVKGLAFTDGDASFDDAAVTGLGDLQTAFEALQSEVALKLPIGATLADITDVPIRWGEHHTNALTTFEVPPDYGLTNFAGTDYTMEYTTPDTDWYLTGDGILAFGTPPADDTREGATWFIRIMSQEATNCAFAIDPSVPTSMGPGTELTQILPSETVMLWVKWHGTNATYMYVQSQGVTTWAHGGNDSTNGEAVSALSTLYYPIVTTTNVQADFHLGRDAEIRASGNIHFQASSQRAPSTNHTRWTYYDIIATGADRLVSARSDWVLDGWTNGTTISNGNTFSVLVKSKGPSETNTWAYNRHATTFLLSGSGSPPASTLTSGLVEYWNVEDTAAPVVGQIAGINLTSHGANMTYQVAGQVGTYALTNSSTAKILTNSAAALELGLSGDSFSFAIIFVPNTTATAYIAGRQDSSQIAWMVREQSGGSVFQFQVSSSGTSASATAASTISAVAGTPYLIVGVFDNANNLIKISVNGEAFVTAAFASNIFDSSAPFSICGAYVSGVPSNCARGIYDQPAMWNRALTQSEVDELYDMGNYKDLDTL